MLWPASCRLLLEETSKPGKLRSGNTYFLKVLVYIADGSVEFRMFQTGAGDRAQLVKVLSAKPDGPSSIPRTHLMQVGNWILKVVFWPPHACWGMCSWLCPPPVINVYNGFSGQASLRSPWVGGLQFCLHWTGDGVLCRTNCRDLDFCLRGRLRRHWA